MKLMKAPAALVELFDELVPPDADIERRKLFGYPACFINGNMFAGLHEDHLLVRLGEQERREFLAIRDTRVFEPMPGRPMREYVVASPAMLKRRGELSQWIATAARYARELPPKVPKKAR